MARPLWSNSAILTVVRRATNIVKAHTDLDKVTENRVNTLVFGHKRVSNFLPVLVSMSSTNSFNCYRNELMMILMWM